jgi:predicted DNA-binding transcriptional regulator AlpA
MTLRRLRYRDLVALGIVNNRATLSNWVRCRGFPPGQLTGPNTRTWGEDEVRDWLNSRPSAPKPTTILKNRRSRSRKVKRAERSADKRVADHAAAPEAAR